MMINQVQTQRRAEENDVGMVAWVMALKMWSSLR